MLLNFMMIHDDHIWFRINGNIQLFSFASSIQLKIYQDPKDSFDTMLYNWK